MATRSVRVSEGDLRGARAAVVRFVQDRWGVSLTRERRPPAPVAEPEELRVTEFQMNAEGVITGKTERTRLLVPEAPAEPEPQSPFIVPLLTDDEVRAVAGAPYATRVRPCVVAFDWSVAERAIGRKLREIDRIRPEPG